MPRIALNVASSQSLVRDPHDVGGHAQILRLWRLLVSPLHTPVVTAENEQVVPDSDARALVLQTLLLEAIETAQMAICVYGDDGRYVTVNDCACAILGYNRDELLMHDIGDFTAGGIDRKVLLRDEWREGVRLVTRKDGSKVPVAFVVAPTRVGHLPYFVSVWWTLDANDPRAADAA